MTLELVYATFLFTGRTRLKLILNSSPFTKRIQTLKIEIFYQKNNRFKQSQRPRKSDVLTQSLSDTR